MKRSTIHPLPHYFDRYILQVPDLELADAFAESVNQLNRVDVHRWGQLSDMRYADGKWTLNDVIVHITDTERIMCYRTLLFARGDSTKAPGFDQDLFAANAKASARSLASVFEELQHVRRATIDLFESLDDEALLRVGINWQYEMSVLAMGFNMIGHQIHHFKIIEDRYLPLLSSRKNGNETR